MPRIRSIKPEALQHRKVGRLSDRALRVWLALLTQADDEGRVVVVTEQVRIWAFGYQPNIRLTKIDEAIQEVAKDGLIRLYSVNGTRYANFPSWKDHQKIDRPYKSKLPPPPFDESSSKPQRTLDERSSGIGSDQGSERKGGERGEEPDGALRSASPRDAASLRAPKDGDAALQAAKGVRDLAHEVAGHMSIPGERPIDKAKVEEQKLAIFEIEREATAHHNSE